jgi:hypothetical protein
MQFGKCPVGAQHEDAFMEQLAKKQLNAFSRGHGFYFWNFKTDGNLEPRWSYIGAVEAGWIPKNLSLAILPDPLDGHCESKECKFKAGVDYYGGDLYALPTVSAEGCCEACRIEPKCRAFTYAGGTKFCYLKDGNVESHYFADFISGTYDPKWAIPGFEEGAAPIGDGEVLATELSASADGLDWLSAAPVVMAMAALGAFLAVKMVSKNRKPSAPVDESRMPQSQSAGYNYQLDATEEGFDFNARSI